MSAARRVAAGVLACALAIDCGDDSSSDISVESVLAEAARVSSEYGARFIFSARVEQSGQEVEFSGFGEVEAGGNRDHIVTEIGGITLEQFTDGRYFVSDRATLTARDRARLAAGTRWVRVDQREYAENLGVQGSTLQQVQNLDPARQLVTYRSLASEVSMEGTEEVRGQETTRYRMLLRYEDLIEVLTAGAEEPREPHPDLLELVVPVDVWVDSGARVRRVRLTVEHEELGLEIETEITELDRRLRVDVPDGPSVQQVDWLPEAFGG